MWRVGAAVALGVALVVAGLVVTLSQRAHRLAGSNAKVETAGITLPVAPGRLRCAVHQEVPAESASVRMVAAAERRARSPITVSIASGGRQLSTGSVAAGDASTPLVRVPIQPVRTNLYDATVCVQNRGTRRESFAGNLTPVAGPRLAGEDVIRFDWLLPGRPSWWGVSGKVAARSALLKPSFVGAWTLWAAFGVIAGLWAAAIAIVVRHAPR
jgi:hypothetical protein